MLLLIQLTVHIGKLPILGSVIIIGKRLFGAFLGFLLILAGVRVWRLHRQGRTLAMLGGIMLVVYSLLAPICIALPSSRPFYNFSSWPYVGFWPLVMGIIFLVYTNRSRVKETFDLFTKDMESKIWRRLSHEIWLCLRYIGYKLWSRSASVPPWPPGERFRTVSIDFESIHESRSNRGHDLTEVLGWKKWKGSTKGSF